MNLRKYAKGQQCQVRIPGVCNYDPDTTVLAHIRMNGLTGMGEKAPDLLGAWCCSACHEHADQYRSDGARYDFMLGILRTQAQLIRQGIVTWDAPAPDTQGNGTKTKRK